MTHVTPQQQEQYRTQGYFILEGVIPNDQLDGLRSECDRLVLETDREMEAKGITSYGISHYKQRYFIANRGKESEVIAAFLFSDLMADVAKATLGDNVWLFHEQYVVKAPEVGTKFAWHQDSGYIGHYHTPYLSCWCALDDMTLENGTIYVLPYDRAGMTSDDLFDHTVEAKTNDKIGYKGDDPGVPAIVPAGSIVVFSSRTFHRSGTNVSKNVRRSFLAQYSKEVIMNKEGTAPWGQDVPFIQDGQQVRRGQAVPA